MSDHAVVALTFLVTADDADDLDKVVDEIDSGVELNVLAGFERLGLTQAEIEDSFRYLGVQVLRLP